MFLWCNTLESVMPKSNQLDCQVLFLESLYHLSVDLFDCWLPFQIWQLSAGCIVVYVRFISLWFRLTEVNEFIPLKHLTLRISMYAWMMKTARFRPYHHRMNCASKCSNEEVSRPGITSLTDISICTEFQDIATLKNLAPNLTCWFHCIPRGKIVDPGESIFVIA